MALRATLCPKGARFANAMACNKKNHDSYFDYATPSYLSHTKPQPSIDREAFLMTSAELLTTNKALSDLLRLRICDTQETVSSKSLINTEITEI
jgi:hypothetical protein